MYITVKSCSHGHLVSLCTYVFHVCAWRVAAFAAWNNSPIYEVLEALDIGDQMQRRRNPITVTLEQMEGEGERERE